MSRGSLGLRRVLCLFIFFTLFGLLAMFGLMLVDVFLFATFRIRDIKVYLLVIFLTCLPLIVVLVVTNSFERGKILTSERECKLVVNGISNDSIHVVDGDEVKEPKVGNVSFNVSTKGYSYAVLTDYSWRFFYQKDRVTKIYIAESD